ncbi:uncharacterized protein LOC108164087 [Drosophila miranda]|uniref:uncharacterized protein LOC108164087 n=1 Tax=Drosophila miranda TaxID=7229 RepID=UPI0007E7C758|nr:uncharacterized protein LOC108164087 [Drosophila miranda]XP_017155165.1 uncharacterized protein LOC108164087 [Drosophila miranda]XP_017155166.1 uncharacterized protein LOC108164087 [Drosophila miranda]
MPAAIVIVKQREQRQEHREHQQRERKQICNINLCEFLRRSGADDDDDVDVQAERNPGQAAGVDVAARAAEGATARTAGVEAGETGKRTTERAEIPVGAAVEVGAQAPGTKRRAAAARTTRTVIIIMALVVGIMQQQLQQGQQEQEQEQQEQQEQQQQQKQLLWPFYNGLLFAAAATAPYNSSSDDFSLGGSVDGPPTLSTFLSAPSSLAASSSSAAEAPPQTDATNHTFKSLAFLAGIGGIGPVSFGSDLFALGTETEMDRDRGRERDTDLYSDLSQSLPIFDFGMPRNITGRTGHTEAIIKCRVDSLHDKSVSWIRKRDLHILTVGTATYTSDKRFQVTESKDAREWTLHVKSPQARDSGIYECQVNTEPKMSMAFQLNIIEISPDAKAVISGPPDLHFKAGSAIILNCVVQQPSVKDIGPIYWYRGEHMITPFDADDGESSPTSPKQELQRRNGASEMDSSPNDVLSDVDLQREFATRIAMESQLGDTLKSRLRIANAQTTDTGNYTCQPTTASSASVLVHVINDENPAAMQKSEAFALPGLGLRLELCWMFLLVLALSR